MRLILWSISNLTAENKKTLVREYTTDIVHIQSTETDIS